MAETHDTIKGLLAEFREHAVGVLTSGYVTMSGRDFHKMLDRLDTAHKREMSKNASKNGADFGQLGNAAKDVARQLRAWAEQVDPFSKDGSAPRRLRALAARLEGDAK